MINVTVCGACGRMGEEVVREILSSSEFALSGAVEAPGHPRIGERFGGVAVTSDLKSCLEKTDAVADFTLPPASLENAAVCAAAEVPMVIGTTGFSAAQREEIRTASASIPILLSPNMSAGINMLLSRIGEIVSLLPGYDIEIIEKHHGGKQDAPSGTALRIAGQIRESNSELAPVFGRTGARKAGEIGVHAVRGGDIVGEHTVILAGEGETLEITHRAVSRKAFAAGTLRGLKLISGKDKGLYSMEDLLEE